MLIWTRETIYKILTKRKMKKATTIVIPIVGIRHHDYGDNLERLYGMAMGHVATLMLQPDNKFEANAVPCSLLGKCLGYVRSGQDREQMHAALLASGRKSLTGHVVRVDRELRVVYVEVKVSGKPKALPKTVGHMLSSWSYDGPVLPTDMEMLIQQSQASTMIDLLSEQPEQWNEDLECLLVRLCDNGWSDLSGENFDEMRTILSLLTQASTRSKDFANAASRLQYAMDYMSSPESQQKRLNRLHDLAQSEGMEQLLHQLGDQAQARVESLPRELLDNFDQKPCELLSRLWYLRESRTRIWQVISLLAVRLALSAQTGRGQNCRVVNINAPINNYGTITGDLKKVAQ